MGAISGDSRSQAQPADQVHPTQERRQRQPDLELVRVLGTQLHREARADVQIDIRFETPPLVDRALRGLDLVRNSVVLCSLELPAHQGCVLISAARKRGGLGLGGLIMFGQVFRRRLRSAVSLDDACALTLQLGDPALGVQIIRASVVADDTTASPLVFRRTTAFQSSLLGNSVPVWGSGLAASQSFGPFLDDNGLHIWFDFYQPLRMVSVCLKGSSTPVLLIPVWGTITPKKTYKIEAGSVWIASSLIVNNSSLAGYYTGLKVRGRSLELSGRRRLMLTGSSSSLELRPH